MSDTLIRTADLLLRAGACLLLALLAALVLRDHGRVAAGWFGSLFAAGTAAFTLCSAPGMHELLGWWSAPILAGASGNNLVFWLFARALFDDGFRPRPWHGVLWLAIVAAGVIEVLMLEPAFSPAAAPLGIALTAQTVLFAILGGVQVVATWRGDLVEPRRRLRLFLVGATAVYTVVTAGTGFLRTGPGSEPGSLAQIALLTLILAAVAARCCACRERRDCFPSLLRPRVRPTWPNAPRWRPTRRWSLPSNGRSPSTAPIVRRGCRSVSSPCGSAYRNTGCASRSTRGWVKGTSPPS